MKSALNLFLIFLMVAIPSMLRAQFERYGLEGRIVYDLAVYGSTIYAATDQGAYARYRFAGRDTGWVLLGLKGKTVRTIYPHQFGPIGYAVTAGVERKPGDPESTLVYCSQFRDTAWAPADTGIARTTINGIRSIRGFPTLAICGETFAGGEGKVYRRPPYPWEEVFDIGIGATNVVRTNEEDATVWVGGETGIFAPYVSFSPDKGKTWNTTYPNLGGDNACNSLAFAHRPAPVVYAGMEGTVITSKDSGRTWTSTTLSGTPYYFYGLAVYEEGSQSLWVFAGGSTSTGQFGLYQGNIRFAVDGAFPAVLSQGHTESCARAREPLHGDTGRRCSALQVHHAFHPERNDPGPVLPRTKLSKPVQSNNDHHIPDSRLQIPNRGDADGIWVFEFGMGDVEGLRSAG